jgi:hypothetical protein
MDVLWDQLFFMICQAVPDSAVAELGIGINSFAPDSSNNKTEQTISDGECQLALYLLDTICWWFVSFSNMSKCNEELLFMFFIYIYLFTTYAEHGNAICLEYFSHT